MRNSISLSRHTKCTELESHGLSGRRSVGRSRELRHSAWPILLQPYRLCPVQTRKRNTVRLIDDDGTNSYLVDLCLLPPLQQQQKARFSVSRSFGLPCHARLTTAEICARQTRSVVENVGLGRKRGNYSGGNPVIEATSSTAGNT